MISGKISGGCTRSSRLHAWIDSGFLTKTRGIDESMLIQRAKPAAG